MKVTKQDTHAGYYSSAGDRLPSVTTISKLIERSEGLIHWAWKLGMEGKDYKKVRDDAASAGHICHAMIEARVRGQEFIGDPESEPEAVENAKRSFQGFCSWLDSSNFMLIRSEVRLISERYQYGGRLDCIATISGEPCILDWKTSSAVYPGYLVQVAGYRGAWNETNRAMQIQGCHLIRIKKDDGGFVHHYFGPETIDKAWKAFLICRELHDLQKELTKAI